MTPRKTLIDHIKENHHGFHLFFVLIVASAISMGFFQFALRTSAQTSPNSVKVLTWNNGGGDSSAEIAAIVAQRPQIVFLQEVDTTAHFNNIRNALQADQGGQWSAYFALRGTDTSSSYIGIVSRYALTNQRELIIRPAGTYVISCYSNTPVTYAGRKVLGANATINGTNVSLFAVRATSPGDMDCVRQGEINALRQWADNSANGFYAEKIYGGDFNTQPFTASYNIMVSAPNNSTDVWLYAVNAGTATADGSTPTASTPTRNTRLDYIFRQDPSSASITSAAISDVGTLSDHRMMSAVFNISSLVTPTPFPTPTPTLTLPPTSTPFPGFTPTPTPVSTAIITPNPTPGTFTPAPQGGVGPTAFETFDLWKIPKILSGLACYGIRFGIILFTIAIVYTGIKFLLSRGNPMEFNKNRKIFFMVLLGGLVVFGVYTIIFSLGAYLGYTTVPLLPLNCS